MWALGGDVSTVPELIVIDGTRDGTDNESFLDDRRMDGVAALAIGRDGDGDVGSATPREASISGIASRINFELNSCCPL